MAVTYRPIVRWKRGERVGLAKLTPAGRINVVPILCLGPDQFSAKKATKVKAAMTAPASLVADIEASWGKAWCYVDASSLPAGAAAHPIVDIAAIAATNGLRIIPMTTLHAPAIYQSGVSNAVARLGYGVGLRLNLQDMTSAPTWISSWPYSPSDTDLVVDLSDGVGMAASLGAALDHAFMTLHAGASWRSVTLAGTSMPPNFTGVPAGLHTILRSEFGLWQRISALSLPYQLSFGDYATVSPNGAPQNIAWGFPINVRYTLPAHFLVCRGVGTTGPRGVDMEPQLLAHAKSISGYSARHPLLHCWADGTIDRIAAGAAGPQALEHWVQLGVNRHIEMVRATLP
jgi:hypothetical protein